MDRDGFVRRVDIRWDKVSDRDAYPFAIPAIRNVLGFVLHPSVTYFVGENGSGKSTLLEALAVALGFNAEGGSANFRFATRSSESPLHEVLRLSRSARRPRTGFFLRAESFFNVGTHIEELDREPGLGPPIIRSFGGTSLHEQSHGESFWALFRHRFGPEGLYILDEPESALSPRRQVEFLARLNELVLAGSQFIIATHAPIVLAHPDALIYQVTQEGLERRKYDETECVQVAFEFLYSKLRPTRT